MNINELSDNVLRNICSFLQDFDLKSLGSTSKKMNAFVKKRLDSRDRVVRKHLRKNYYVSRKFNLKSFLTEADLYLLGELHIPKCRLDHARLFNLLASRGPVIFVCEGAPSMKTTLAKQKPLLHMIDPRFKGNVYPIGWDDLKEVEKYTTLEDQIKQKETQYRQEILDFQAQIPMTLSLISRFELWNGEMSSHEEIDHQMQQILILNKRVSKMLTKYNGMLEQHSKELRSCLAEGFPIRKGKMIETLRNISKFKSKFKIQHAKVVLVAGSSHLETPKDLIKDHRYDLSSLYEELKNHKAVILLHNEAYKKYY